MNIGKTITSTTLCAVIVLAMGCASDEASPSSPDSVTTINANTNALQRVEVAPKPSSRWVGHEIGVSPGKWYDRGKMKFAPKGAKPPVVEVTPGSSVASASKLDRHTVMRGDPVTGQMYEIEMNETDRRALANVLEKRGYADGTPGAAGTMESENDELVAKGWSNGTDSRTPRGIYEYGVVSEPLQKIGQLEDFCTATFVGAGSTGSYYIITAAHCFWEEGSGDYLDPNFTPRRDGCKRPDGTSIAGCDTTPYGVWNGGVWLMPTYFVDNCRGLGSFSDDCTAADIAVQRVARPSGEAFPGAMGFGTYSLDTLNGYSKYNKGYPNCNGAGDPVTNCRTRTLYGDSNLCQVGDGAKLDGDDWHQILHHSCDISPGMSGSPLYLYSSGAKVFGVMSTEHCSGSACTEGKPNEIRRITPWWYDEMLSFVAE